MKSSSYCLIIPTHNRPHSLAKLLAYLDGKEFPEEIYLLDSSTEENHLQNEGSVERHENLKVKHVRYEQTVFFYEKLYRCISSIEHDCIALCADDDIIIPEVLPDLVSQITSNPGTVFSHGITTRFWEKSHKNLLLDLEYNAIDYPEDNPLLRIQKLYASVESFFWAVYKREAFLKTLEHTRKIDSLLFGEMLTVVLILCQGKGIRIPNAFLYRSCEPNSEEPQNWHPVFWILEDRKRFFEHYINYRNTIADFLSSNSELTIGREKTEAFLDITFINFFTPQWERAKGKVLGHLDELINGKSIAQKKEYPTFHAPDQSVSKKVLHSIDKIARQLLGLTDKQENHDTVHPLSYGSLDVQVNSRLSTALGWEGVHKANKEILPYF